MCWAINLCRLVVIALTDLSKSGNAMQASPAPTGLDGGGQRNPFKCTNVIQHYITHARAQCMYYVCRQVQYFQAKDHERNLEHKTDHKTDQAESLQSCQVQKKILFLMCDLQDSFVFLMAFKVYILYKLNPFLLILPFSM